MRKVIVKMPLQKANREGQGMLIYANYVGEEQVVNEGEKRQRGVSRLFLIENNKGKQYAFRIFGNGRYELSRTSDRGPRVLARGTMLDRYRPEVISVY